MFLPHLSFPLFPPSSSKRVQRFAVLSEPGLVLRREGSLRKGNQRKGLYWPCSRFLRRCKDWVGDFSSLEAEVLEFMQNSNNPEAFPTKEELVAAGRVDLVEAIVKRGGWLAYGWDLNEGFIESDDFENGSGSEIDGNATRVSGVPSSSSSSSSSANSSVSAESV